MGICHKEAALADATTIGLSENIGDGVVVSYEGSSIEPQPYQDIDILEDSIALLKRDAGNMPRLTREEEAQFSEKIQLGKRAEQMLLGDGIGREQQQVLQQQINEGHSARNELVSCNILLAVSFCKTYIGRGISYEDLIQEGSIGMMRAADTYDPSKGGFANHATWWMKGYVSNAFRKHRSQHRVPEYSIDALFDDDIYANDVIADPAGVAEYEAAEYGAVVEDVRNTAIRTLDPREFAIYRYRNEFDFTCAETGDRLGLSRKRISALDIEIRAKLRPEIDIYRDVVADNV